MCMFSGFCCTVNEIFALLTCYTTLTGSLLPTFQDNLLVPPARVKKMGPIGFTAMPLTNNQSTPCNIPEERRSYVNCTSVSH